MRDPKEYVDEDETLSVETPEMPAYFFEITQRRKRLIYCIPLERLVELVEEKHARKTILRDYPDGVDIEVSEASFNWYSMRYRLKPPGPGPAWALYKAFDAIYQRYREKKREAKDEFLGTGYIQDEVLEELAWKMYEELEKCQLLKKPETRKKRLRKRDVRMKRQKADLEWIDHVKNVLAEISVPEINVEKSFNEQTFCRVRMKEGDSPITIFNALHTGKKGNSTWQ